MMPLVLFVKKETIFEHTKFDHTYFVNDRFQESATYLFRYQLAFEIFAHFYAQKIRKVLDIEISKWQIPGIGHLLNSISDIEIRVVEFRKVEVYHVCRKIISVHPTFRPISNLKNEEKN